MPGTFSGLSASSYANGHRKRAGCFDLRQLDKSTCVRHLLTFFTPFAQRLSCFCLLCAQEGREKRIVDMQQLKRHFCTAHSLRKDSLASICDLHFANIEMKRLATSVYSNTRSRRSCINPSASLLFSVP